MSGNVRHWELMQKTSRRTRCGHVLNYCDTGPAETASISITVAETVHINTIARYDMAACQYYIVVAPDRPPIYSRQVAVENVCRLPYGKDGPPLPQGTRARRARVP